MLLAVPICIFSYTVFDTGSIVVVHFCALIPGNDDNNDFLLNFSLHCFVFFFLSVSCHTRLGYILRTLPRVFLYAVCIHTSSFLTIRWFSFIGVATDIISLNVIAVVLGPAATVGIFS